MSNSSAKDTTFREQVKEAAASKGYSLLQISGILGYKSYSGFLKALDIESLKGTKLQKLIDLVGPLENIDPAKMPIDILPDAGPKNLLECKKEVEYLKQIIELKDELILSLKKQVSMMSGS